MSHAKSPCPNAPLAPEGRRRMVQCVVEAVNTEGETIEDRWGQLTPVQLPPDETYLPDLIAANRTTRDALVFTAVGYGAGEKFPIPGEETGPANPAGTNLDTFPIRFIADNLTYNAHNPVNDVLRLSMNIAKGENGTCNGDSGGPIFFEDTDLGRVQVSPDPGPGRAVDVLRLPRRPLGPISGPRTPSSRPLQP